MKNNFFNLLIIIIVLANSSFVSAIELHQAGLNTRSRAMGGTMISFVRGSQAIFYNPAALAKLEGFNLNLASVNTGVSTNAIDLADQLQGSGNLDASDLNELYGKQIYTELAAYGGLAIPYFGAGAYSNNTLLMSFNNPSFPTFNVDFVSDYSYVVAGAIPIGPNASFGISGRHIKRWGGQADILITDLLSSDTQTVIEQNINSRGKGNALDLSALVTLKGPMNGNLNLAAVWYDVGDTRFNPTQGVGPERQENNLIFGASLVHEVSFITWTNAFEYKFIRNDGDITKKLHLGTELSLGLFDIRAGYGQGYLSYGAAFDMSFLVIDAALYSAEFGETSGQTQNERYQIGISLNLDFDQSFKLQTSEGKRRRLLQRR